MAQVRLLVGTRKGAFILDSDGKRNEWRVNGPHFAGWEIYHVKGSPLDPNRIYASQSSSWSGQVMQRSDDGGATWETGRQQFRLRRRSRNAPVVRRHAASVGIRARVAPRAVADRSATRSTPASKTRRSFARPTAARIGANSPGLRTHTSGLVVAARRGRHVPAHDPARSEESAAHLHRDLRSRRIS